MPFIDDHRRAASRAWEIKHLKPPFSCFDLIEERFGDYDSIRRIFSLARSSGAESLIIEAIPPTGIIAEENEDILTRYSDFQNSELVRLSFWKQIIDDYSKTTVTSNDLIGYAILKHDEIPSIQYNSWHIFEAVFLKYPHEHNCVPRPGNYRLVVCDHPIEIRGLLYCQQNGLNKACAQVAMRSLLSKILPEGDISYRQINHFAESVLPGFDPGKGLTVLQIRHILNELRIGYTDIDYQQGDDQLRIDLPYQKYAYAGLESGSGAFVGFRLTGQNLRAGGSHIIPFYGHTFNKDTWVPNADVSYFHIGEDVGYFPSESWTSSYLGHDDNFGPNFCIPRLYMESKNVDYVVELFRPGVSYGGTEAEAFAVNILYSVLESVDRTKNKWIFRLFQWADKRQVVFRAQAMSSSEYGSHLKSLTDWEGNTENLKSCQLIEEEIPKFV